MDLVQPSAAGVGQQGGAARADPRRQLGAPTQLKARPLLPISSQSVPSMEDEVGSEELEEWEEWEESEQESEQESEPDDAVSFIMLQEQLAAQVSANTCLCERSVEALVCGWAARCSCRASSQCALQGNVEHYVFVNTFCLCSRERPSVARCMHVCCICVRRPFSRA